MKKVEHYICDICGTEYADEKMAADCEAYHVRPHKIHKSFDKRDWIPFKAANESEAGKYPKRINVEMQDGSVWTYVKAKCYDRDVSALRKAVSAKLQKEVRASKKKKKEASDDKSN